MNSRYFLFICVALVCSSACSAQRCTEDDETLQATIRREAKLPEEFTLRGAERPDLEEKALALQKDAANPKPSPIQEIRFCHFAPFLYQLENGKIVTTTVLADSELSWLVGLDSRDEQYLLAGFPDPLNGFNALIKALNLNIESADTARDVFDLYLTMVWGQKAREFIIVDDMQLQSLALSDFRMRYSLPKARAMYLKWWRSMTPEIRKRLHKPEVVATEGGFTVKYVRYHQGQILPESILIDKDGTVTVGAHNKFYPAANFTSR